MTPSRYVEGPQCEAIKPLRGFMVCSVHVLCPSVSVEARPWPGGDLVTEVAAAGRGSPHPWLGVVMALNKAARKGIMGVFRSVRSPHGPLEGDEEG